MTIAKMLHINSYVNMLIVIVCESDSLTIARYSDMINSIS